MVVTMAGVCSDVYVHVFVCWLLYLYLFLVLLEFFFLFKITYFIFLKPTDSYCKGFEKDAFCLK